MILTEETITKYIQSIANTNTRNTYRLSLNKFKTYPENNQITDKTHNLSFLKTINNKTNKLNSSYKHPNYFIYKYKS